MGGLHRSQYIEVRSEIIDANLAGRHVAN